VCGKSPVYEKDLPCDVGGRIGSEKRYHSRNLAWISPAAQCRSMTYPTHHPVTHPWAPQALHPLQDTTRQSTEASKERQPAMLREKAQSRSRPTEAHGSELHGYPIPRMPITFDLRQDPVRESRTPGSARGAAGNSRPYRDPRLALSIAIDLCFELSPRVNTFLADHLRGLGLRRGWSRGSHGA
jgi:hypothetical protein